MCAVRIAMHNFYQLEANAPQSQNRLVLEMNVFSGGDERV